MQINFNQLWKKDLGLIYKEISIDKGKQFKTDIDLKEVKNIIGGVYGYSVINNAKEEASLSLACETDTLSEIEIVNALTNNNVKTLDVSNVTNKEEIMLNDNNIDLSKLVTLLVSEVKKIKNEIKDLKSRKLRTC